MERREFIKACALTCALGRPEVLSAQDLKPRFYSRAQLMNERGQLLRTADIVAGRNYIFHYPFEATPCFLLNLGKPTVRDVQLKTENGSMYFWPGGSSATVRHLMPVGNPAPPRPRRPEAVTSSIVARGPISMARSSPTKPPRARYSSTEKGSITPQRANVRRCWRAR